MSGHSHWAGIKYKKAMVDARKGRLFSKLARAITTAARTGGGNPETNLHLKYAIEKARAVNVTKEMITRAIQKGTGELPGVELVELLYEGYGPGGVAIMVEALSDNRNRTAAAVRKIFELRGGNLGSSGCVSWTFEKKGLIRIPKAGVEEDELLAAALDAEAEDMKPVGDFYEVSCGPSSLEPLKQALTEAGFKLGTAEISQIPKNTVPLSADEGRKLIKLLDQLEEQEDVQNVYANFDIPEDVLVEMEST